MKKSRRFKHLSVVVGVVLATLTFFFFPLGTYAELPGDADSLKTMVQVEGHPDRADGKFMMTTVAILGPLTPATWLWSEFQEAKTIVPARDLIGDQSPQEYEYEQEYNMTEAQNNAVSAAFLAAKMPYTRKDEGVVVLSILKGSSFKKDLKPGDRITAVDGVTYDTVEEMMAATSKRRADDTVRLTRIRDNKTTEVSGKLMTIPGTKRAGIGIALGQKSTVTSTPKVTIKAGDIGGPSAGLMFTIQIYSQLTGKDLRHGANIAGTGTIDPDGTVGQIGGIDKKIVAAEREGATIFFAPDQPLTEEIKKNNPNYVNNYDLAVKTAKAINSKMKVVPVRKLKDALDYLENKGQNAAQAAFLCFLRNFWQKG